MISPPKDDRANIQSPRIRPYEVDGKMMQLKFTEEEFAMLVSAFKDMANRLKETADAIEKGRMC